MPKLPKMSKMPKNKRLVYRIYLKEKICGNLRNMRIRF